MNRKQAEIDADNLMREQEAEKVKQIKYQNEQAEIQRQADNAERERRQTEEDARRKQEEIDRKAFLENQEAERLEQLRVDEEKYQERAKEAFNAMKEIEDIRLILKEIIAGNVPHVKWIPNA